MRTQLARCGINDLELFFDADGEAVSHVEVFRILWPCRGTLSYVSYPAELKITLTRSTAGMQFIGNKAKAQTGMSIPPETCWVGPFLNSPLSLKYVVLYAAPIALRCWKHSRQNTGRP